MKLIYPLYFIFSVFNPKPASASTWTVFQDTSTACPFSFEYPKEKGFELKREFATPLPEERERLDLLLDIGFLESLGDPAVQPIDVMLAIDVHKLTAQVDRWPGGLIMSEPNCPHSFPWKHHMITRPMTPDEEKREDDRLRDLEKQGYKAFRSTYTTEYHYPPYISTVTLPSGIQATEYRYCEEVSSEIGLTENAGDVVQFPHEIIVRVVKRPTCTIKLTLQIPLLFEKDYSKIDWSLPPKDTPELKKKKLAIRSKLLRSLDSFRLLKAEKNPSPKKKNRPKPSP